MLQPNLKTLVDLRKSFHKYPELSGKEKSTSEKLKNLLKNLNLFHFNKVGKHAFLATVSGKQKGLHIVFRAELDALPITENNQFEYKSLQPKVSHKCGHDGHMTILVGLAQWLKQNPIEKGKVSLLFQSAEETGMGAADVLKNWPKNIKPDLFFALHNLPNQTFGSIHCKSGTFSSASKGVIINFTGKESHAAEPQNGKNPISAIGKISEFAAKYRNLKGKGLITVIHTKVGSKAFGTSPGKGVLMLTLRTQTNEKLSTIENALKAFTEKVCNEEGIEFSFSDTEHFFHTYNSSKAVKMLQTVCNEQGLQYQKMELPFAWSEDFGRFTHKYSGALFAVGAGNQEPLHSPSYDFNDDLIPIGIQVFASLIKKYLA